MEEAKTNWEALRAVPPDSRPGHPRGNCETCGLALWSTGGYKVPGMSGYYCSILCAEQAQFGTKKSAMQTGERLLMYLKRYPEAFRAVMGARQGAPRGKTGELFAGLEG